MEFREDTTLNRADGDDWDGRTIGRGYHSPIFPIIPIFPIFPINSTSISKINLLLEGLQMWP